MATVKKITRKKGVVYKAEVRLKGYPRVSQTFELQSEAVKWGGQ